MLRTSRGSTAQIERTLDGRAWRKDGCLSESRFGKVRAAGVVQVKKKGGGRSSPLPNQLPPTPNQHQPTATYPKPTPTNCHLPQTNTSPLPRTPTPAHCHLPQPGSTAPTHCQQTQHSPLPRPEFEFFFGNAPPHPPNPVFPFSPVNPPPPNHNHPLQAPGKSGNGSTSFFLLFRGIVGPSDSLMVNTDFFRVSGGCCFIFPFLSGTHGKVFKTFVSSRQGMLIAVR